jgi:exopolysaccharide production protein ExoY
MFHNGCNGSCKMGMNLKMIKSQIESPNALFVETKQTWINPMPVWKRAVDILGAIVSLLILVPQFLVVAIFVKIVSPGPVFFKQRRIGYLGKQFTMWKFRTMHLNAATTIHQKHLSDLINNEVPMEKLDEKKDSRIIPLGAFFRRTGFDELPQIINVLKGDMSLVGPRPCLPYEAEQYQDWHKRRFFAVPGITGLWQVNGKNKTTFAEMISLDVTYLKKLSFWNDIKIIVKTIPSLIKQ